MVGKLLVLCLAAVEEQLPACLPASDCQSGTYCSCHHSLSPFCSPRHAPPALQRGTTGFPLVDAGMRELWQTGYCCNYVRHIVAGFLIGGWFLKSGWMGVCTCTPCACPQQRRPCGANRRPACLRMHAWVEQPLCPCACDCWPPSCRLLSSCPGLPQFPFLPYPALPRPSRVCRVFEHRLAARLPVVSRHPVRC